jgi:membrane protease YdiL (CAAX protease family)
MGIMKYDMTAFIEALILFLVLFFLFPSNSVPQDTPVEFFASAEIIKTIFYTIPSIALVWYLLLKAKNLKQWGIARPGKNDVITVLMTFPALVMIGAAVFFVYTYLGTTYPDNTNPSSLNLVPPQTVFSWSVLVMSVIFSALLEESYFRFYLLSKHEDMKLNPHIAVLMSTILFAYCHLYEGPWGFLNAILSGLVLSYLFLRYRSLYGIWFGHALYNVLVWVLAGYN